MISSDMQYDTLLKLTTDNSSHHLPVASVDVELSFTKYGSVLHQSLSTDSLTAYCSMFYNSLSGFK